jgi:PAS domain S-box-containing protein
MLYHASGILLKTITKLPLLKDKVLQQWVSDEDVTTILEGHNIAVEVFRDRYANDVFDFFVDVLEGKIEVGDCPVIGNFLEYLKDRDVCAQELFVICSQFRQAMIDYAVKVCDDPVILSKELSYIFDKNFTGVLKRYTDTIFQKNQEIAKNEKLLGEYKKAIDESAIVSKTDTNGLITFVNDNFIKRCGYSEEELIGTRHGIVWDENECMELFRRIHNKVSKGEVFHDTVKNSKKNGDDYYVDMTMIPIYDHNGNISEYMEISYEVTRLIKATREAIAADKAKEYFLSNMSHEIRTPLNAILGFVSLLESETLSQRHKQYLNIIHNSGENLLSIMNDILDFSKLQSGEFMVESQPFNIHEELSKTLELFVSSANEKQITLLSYFDPSIPHILVADILRIKQIVSNFISNAIKFSAPSSTIEIRVSCRKFYLSISIKDWGIGLSESDISRIFDPFSQVKSDVEQLVAGTGLGLSICKKLAEHMDGEILVESKKGEGSLFTLKIPVDIQESSCNHLFDPKPFRDMKTGIIRLTENKSKTLESLEYYFDFFNFERDKISVNEVGNYDLVLFLDEEMDKKTLQMLKSKNRPMIAIMEHLSDRYDSEAMIAPLFFPFYCAKIYDVFAEAIGGESAHKDLQTKSQRRFKAKVLVAEDNAANQELIKVLLERYGIEYIIVSDGLQAVNNFKNIAFDMILMDEQMPVKTGLEATKEIILYEKKHQQQHTPIIALTANVIKGAKERGIRSGYDAFLGKPVVIKELEHIFEIYLEELECDMREVVQENPSNSKGGINFADLQNELQLDIDQLKILLGIYVKKMDEILPILLDTIIKKDLEKVRNLAHNIKGSSANFRFDEIQRIANVIEDSASENDMSFEYLEAYKVLEDEYKKIALYSK